MDSELHKQLDRNGFPGRSILVEGAEIDQLVNGKKAVAWGNASEGWYCIYEMLPAPNNQDDKNNKVELYLIGARSPKNHYYTANEIYPPRKITWQFLTCQVSYVEENISLPHMGEILSDPGMPLPSVHVVYWDLGTEKPQLDNECLILEEQIECDIRVSVLRKHGMM